MNQRLFQPDRTPSIYRQRAERRFRLFLLGGGAFLLGLCLLIYFLPPVHERLAGRIADWQEHLRYAFSPPEQAVFIPSDSNDPSLLSATATPTPPPFLPAGPGATPTITLTPTLVPTPIPAQAQLSGIRHEYQAWKESSGPVNLAMALSFWGWQGSQRDTADFLRPNIHDKNVMPYEIAEYITTQANMSAVTREGGDLQTLKRLVAAGYPVIIETGLDDPSFNGWMGHYQVISGYDDTSQRFTAQDSLKGSGFQTPYDELLQQWRAFDYLYIVPYPPEREEALKSILGLDYYENFNQHSAQQRAEQEIKHLQGRDLFFALFNLGANWVRQRDYTAAATAYDAAFANYAALPEAQRPWRILWYQTGPYFAYYYTDRFQDIINLATTTLESTNEPMLEESYYWRAKALLAQDQEESAVEDLRQCLEVHPGFSPCIQELQQLGIEP